MDLDNAAEVIELHYKSDDDKVNDDKAEDDSETEDDKDADDDKEAQTPRRPSGKGRGSCSLDEYIGVIADTIDEDLPRREAELLEQMSHHRSGKGASNDLQRLAREFNQMSTRLAVQDFVRSACFMEGAACMRELSASCHRLARMCEGDRLPL